MDSFVKCNLLSYPLALVCQDIQELARHFGVDMEQCHSHWHQVHASLEGIDQSADQTMTWITGNLSTSHPALYRIAAVGLLLPTSTADCERGFSCLKRVKTENRNCLSVKVLNYLLAVSLQGPPLESFNFEKAVKAWNETGPLLMMLMKKKQLKYILI
ncbi:uncharacterized protein LOC132749834 [Ruditapes philippinarum]|uniref:uncharacterized protein LOC132749834 n=1 Tax=Ruditapes philippinarum TaxID=129788 RepID=UPI00295C0042|nr:uncharacterized protein LOC132749834 [Ruditapes philippinarum]